ncbi:MAG: ABC transporter permease [Campylobacterota bacterium]|nr:ABC transporter permease [Campylobacterota bacterium]
MFSNALLLAFREIKRNLLRSFLTVLGIVIGVASVIAMVTLGDATTANVKNNIEKLGSNMLTLRPGEERLGAARGDNRVKPFNMADLNAIKYEINLLKAVAPEVGKNINAVYGNKSHSTSLMGTNNDYFIVKDWDLKDGRYFEENELKSGKSVCIIGSSIAEQLFLNENPIGAVLRLEKLSCSVIGLLESKGATAFGRDQDDIIIAPIKMAQRRIMGNKDISSILISVRDNASIENAKRDITLLMQERRDIQLGEKDNFRIRDMRDILDTMTSTTKVLTYLLGAVAAISLLVGGIGIMNIMLVSVTERTKEIGIRLAIGAMENDVLLQFLVEAVVLSTIGGVLGIFLGVTAAYFLTIFFQLPFILNEMIIIISFLFSTFIGVIFGYFPARKAARLNPIDALRHE